MRLVFIFRNNSSIIGTSSPLGELFDHGCDALNTTVLNFLLLHFPLIIQKKSNKRISITQLFCFVAGSMYYSSSSETWKRLGFIRRAYVSSCSILSHSMGRVSTLLITLFLICQIV
jgi:hypothetical protein